jgi:hypothetical protein
MPRGVLIEYAGALFHVMCRAARRERIFLDGYDRGLFLRTWCEACAVLQRGLDHLSVTLEAVRDMKTSDPRKECLAWLFKSKTSMRNTWIAAHLNLGLSSRLCLNARSV